MLWVTDVLTNEVIENFLLHSGFTEPSLVAMRPKYDRIIRRMRERGFEGLTSDKAVTELDSILLHTRRSQRLPRSLWPLIQSQAECAKAVWRNSGPSRNSARS